MRCKLCRKEADADEYCTLHEKAYQNLTEKFEVWKKALEISWRDYLKEIAKNPFTGEKAKEVAEALMSLENEHALGNYLSSF